MFSFFRNHQSDALAPLVALARSRHGYDRHVFLSELRRDAPTVAAMIEHQLALEERMASGSLADSASAPAAPRVRQEVRATVAFSDVSSLSTTGG